MIAIKTLQKRLDRLEDRPTAGPDIVELVLQTLSDDDLDLLHEQATLRETGFDEEQIMDKMGDRWQLLQHAVARFNQAAIKLAPNEKRKIE